MRALNPFTGEFYRETLHVSRYTREMFCLMEGRHVHPSTLYPGGVGTVPTIQLFTDYLVRLARYAEFMKKCVPLHDDLFDFFYEALPGYEKVGYRRTLLGCWGSFNDPAACDYTYKNMNAWGRKMFVTPGVIVDGKLVTNDLVDINLNIRILLGSSYYDDWENGEIFVKNDPLGNPVDRRHPWNQTTIPRPQKRNFEDKYTWVMSPRWYDKRTKELPGARHRRRRHRPVVGDGACRTWWTSATSRRRAAASRSTCPRRPPSPKSSSNGRSPSGATPSSATGPEPTSRRTPPRCAYYFVEQALKELHAGRTKTWTEFKVPDEAIGCGFHEAVRGVLSHHVVIREGQDRQLSSVSADAVERQSARRLRHAGPLRGRGAEHADLRGERARQVQRHRHHAGRAQLRPVPAVRRPHVPGRRQGPRDQARADVRHAEVARSMNGQFFCRPRIPQTDRAGRVAHPRGRAISGPRGAVAHPGDPPAR